MMKQNEAPKSWQISKIGEITLPINKVDPKQFPEKTFRYLDISGIDNQRNILIDHKVYLGKDAPSRARQIVKTNDVLFSTVRTYLKNIAKVPKQFDGEVASTGFSILRVPDELSSDFLFYFALTSQFLNPLGDLQRGSSYPAVRDSDVRNQTIPMPPINEQKRIVAKIEELFTKLDAGVASLQVAQAQLKTYRQALLKHAFEGKLTAQWRADNADKLEDAQTLLQRIQTKRQARHQAELAAWEANGKQGQKPRPLKELPPLTPAELADLPELPAGWAWVRLSEISDQITDGTHHTPTYISSGMPFISVKDIRNEQVNFEECKFISYEEHAELIKRCNPEFEDLLVTKSGTIGRLALVPNKEFSLFVSVALVKIQSVKHLINPRWLLRVFEYHLLTLNIDQDIKGGLLKNYHLEDLRLAKIPLISLNEQNQLVATIEAKLSILDNLEQTIIDALQQAEALRQSILKKAFAGQLVPQDPQDEPASVLLARIRAAKTNNR